MGLLISFWINLQFLLRPYWCKAFTCKPVVQEQVISKTLNADRLMTLVNTWRESQNYQPYIKHEALCKVANDRVKDGMDRHSGFTEKYSNYPSTIGENMNFTYMTEEEALAGWLHSPSHRKLLEMPMTYSCISTSGSLAIQIFSNCENGCY